MVAHGPALSLEVAKTVVEIAEVAWSALEHRREKNHHIAGDDEEREISRLESENRRLHEVLEGNLKILTEILRPHEEDCPPDLYDRLEAVVDSSNFLSKLESLHQESNSVPNGSYPLIEAKVCGDNGELSPWVCVNKDIVSDLEEVSEIDNENYVIICEENVVDGIAEFIAKCVHDNPKAKVLKPEEMRTMITQVLGGIGKSKLKYLWEAGKVIYVLSTWGICLAGLYHGRAVVKAAAIGVHTASKIAVNAL